MSGAARLVDARDGEGAVEIGSANVGCCFPHPSTHATAVRHRVCLLVGVGLLFRHIAGTTQPPAATAGSNDAPRQNRTLHLKEKLPVPFFP